MDGEILHSVGMLTTAMTAIKEFHYDKGISPRCEMPTHKPLAGATDSGVLDTLESILKSMHQTAVLLETSYSIDADPRHLRTHLILEECSEMLQAMYKGDVVEMLDGLADLIYVIVGTAVQFGLPLDLAFDEVHASNMTKTPRTGSRLREKGNTYVAPNIKECLIGTPYYE